MNQQPNRTETDEGPDVIANSTIVNNDVSKMPLGVDARHSRGVPVIGNTISDVGLGIMTKYMNSATFRDNIVTTATTGMFISWSVDGVTARNNSFRNVRWGLDAHFLYRGMSASHDIGTNNTVNGERILRLNGAVEQTIDASDANMVVCANCNDVTIQDMTITDNGHGVVLWDSTASRVKNVTVEDILRTGVLIRGGQNNTIRDSAVIDSTLPIWAVPRVEEARRVRRDGGRFLLADIPRADRLPRQALGSVDIINNRVTVDDASWPGGAVRPDLRGHFGISLFSPTEATVRDNTVTDNRWGVYISRGSSSTLRIRNNTVTPARPPVGMDPYQPNTGENRFSTLGIKVHANVPDSSNGSIVVQNNSLTAGTNPPW